MLKYTYLPRSKNLNLSYLADVLINSFLPDCYEKYLFQNYKMNPAYRSYSEQVPEYLQGRPPALIEHCLSRLQKAKKKFTADSFITCDDVDGIFTITGESSIHHVDFGVANGQPSCTCGDWSKSHFPCKHFFAVFLYKLDWSWDSLPKSYLNGPYLCADADALAQASMLVVYANEGETAAPNDQSNLILDNQSSPDLEIPENQSSSDIIVSGGQTSPVVAAPIHEVSDDTNLVERVAANFADVISNTEDIQDDIQEFTLPQVASDLKKRVST